MISTYAPWVCPQCGRSREGWRDRCGAVVPSGGLASVECHGKKPGLRMDTADSLRRLAAMAQRVLLPGVPVKAELDAARSMVEALTRDLAVAKGRIREVEQMVAAGRTELAEAASVFDTVRADRDTQAKVRETAVLERDHARRAALEAEASWTEATAVVNRQGEELEGLRTRVKGLEALQTRAQEQAAELRSLSVEWEQMQANVAESHKTKTKALEDLATALRQRDEAVVERCLEVAQAEARYDTVLKDLRSRLAARVEHDDRLRDENKDLKRQAAEARGQRDAAVRGFGESRALVEMVRLELAALRSLWAVEGNATEQRLRRRVWFCSGCWTSWWIDEREAASRQGASLGRREPEHPVRRQPEHVSTSLLILLHKR